MSEITFTEIRQFSSGNGNDVVLALVKYNGLIFISLGNFPSGGVGDIFTHNPITGRFLLNSTFGANNSIYAFAVDPADNTLYGGLGPVDGKLYSYDNDGTWTELADTSEIRINSIAVFNGNIYMATSGGTVHKWDGSTLTISLTAAETTSDEVNTLHVHNSLLFAGTGVTPKIFVFDDSSWSLEDTLSGAGVNGVETFEVFSGELYCGTTAQPAVTSLWKRDESVSPVNWIEIHAFSTSGGISTLQSFFDHLYIGKVDTIQRFDGTNVNEVKSTSTDVDSYFQNASLGDGDDCLYFGSFEAVEEARLFSICPRCSDDVLISGASPFGWNAGNCDITPEICLIEDGCFCQISDTGDTITIQIQYNGSGTPRLSIVNVDTGLEVSNTAFVNIVGIIWEVDFAPSTLNALNIQLVVTTKLLNEGEWLDKSIATANPNLGIYVPSLTRIYATGTHLESSSNLGDSFTSKSFPSTGTNDITVATGTGAQDNVFVFLSNGFGSSSDNLVTYDIDNTPAAGGPVVAANFGASDIIAINQNGGARISGNGGSTWAAPANSPITNPGAYNDVFMTSANDILVCDEDGKIFSTNDAGATAWVEDHDAGSSNDLRGIFMNSTTLGWCVGHNGTILKTTDGNTWISKTSGTAQDLNSVWFANTLIGWAVGENSTILKTIDGGDVWVAQTLPASANLNKVDGFLSGSSIVVVAGGDAGKLFVLSSLTTSLGVDLATTECIEVKNDFDCGLLIKYTNDDNFADFDYTNGLVNQIRINAHFWRVENPTEKSIHRTSAEEVIPIRQVVKKQIMLETDIMPEYMHEKLSIIFCHAAIEIDGITYVAEEGYEHDPFPKNFRQSKGHVLLTDKTYAKENIF